ncbi:MAG: hypothetical protein V1676_01690 [Candidatus Diapherotrites archaeon]
MASAIKLDDEIRLNILDALLKKNSVVPSIKQIKKRTGYHKATIKSSLDFLGEQGVLEGFGPKFNFRGLGQGLEVFTLFEADLSDKAAVKKVLAAIEKDPNLYRLSAIIGAGNWNMVAHHIYGDVESYHAGISRKYYEAVPEIYKVIRNRQIFYLAEPMYKNVSRTKSVIEIIRRQKGMV